MPEFLVSDGSDLPKYARFDANGKKMAFVEMEGATGFASAKEAMAARDFAVTAMLEGAKKRVAKWEIEGKLVKQGNGWYRLRGDNRTAHDPLELAMPYWLFDALRANNANADLSISSRASKDDIYGVFEVFYARDQGGGWLCRSQRRADAGSLVWGESFAQAVPFTSEQAALSELQKRSSAGFVLKTSGAFTGVTRVGSPQPDDLSDGVAAACEARDIESALAQSVQERLESYKASLQGAGASSAEPKKAARL